MAETLSPITQATMAHDALKKKPKEPIILSQGGKYIEVIPVEDGEGNLTYNISGTVNPDVLSVAFLKSFLE